MVTPAGVEPAIFWMRTRRPGPLDDGAASALALSEQSQYILTYLLEAVQTGADGRCIIAAING